MKRYEIRIKNYKQAIFEKETEKRISEWFDYMPLTGLVDGTSDFYEADGKEYKFDKVKFFINEVNS